MTRDGGSTPTRCFECDTVWYEHWVNIRVGGKIHCPRCEALSLVIDEDRPYYIRTRPVRPGE